VKNFLPKLLLLLLGLVVALPAPAQILDPTFTPGPNFQVMTLAIQPDGKILSGGGFGRIANIARYGLARLNLDGSLDLTFAAALAGPVSVVALQPDGRILVGGYTVSLLTGRSSTLFRFNSDGTLDSTFTSNIAGATKQVRALLVQPDGKILVGGNFDSVGGLPRNNLARLNADGTVDATFRADANGITAFYAGVMALARQSDGSLLVGGVFTTVGGTVRQGVARLFADGRLDTTFRPLTGQGEVSVIALQPDGKIVLGGKLYFNPQGRYASVARLNVDGTVDPSFSLTYDSRNVRALALLPDGNILTGGGFGSEPDSPRQSLFLLRTNGSTDLTFTPDGRIPGSAYGTVEILSATAEGRIYVGGNYTALSGQPISNLGRLVPSAPLFTASPTNTLAGIGTNVTLTSVVTGLPSTYQWRKNGQPIPGATSASLTFVRLTTTDAATYEVVASNSAGTTTSSPATLTVGTPPVISLQPVPAAAVAGQQSATFTVFATSVPSHTYQWRKNGVTLPGATSSTYTLALVQAADAGNYTCFLSNAYGTVTTAPAILTVLPPARLSNVSVRTTLAAAQSLIVGYVVGGGSTDILVRAAGPALAGFGIPTALPDPRIELYQASTKILENDNWPGALSDTFPAVGAFAFATGSQDAALVHASTGPFSVLATGATAGVVLVETYDLAAATATTTARLINISARNHVGTEADILIAGFNLAGFGTKRILLRAVGPTLGGVPFNLPGVLADPKLTLFDGAGAKVIENDNWDSALASTFAASGAFPLAPSSCDAALVVTLPPGAYTAQVSGVANTTGTALVEVYEVP
jgi:uncharacterized delta-60 repeat protein